MVAMRMGARRATVAGPPATAHEQGSFAVPLHLDMAGGWTARVSLSTPGRPGWGTALRFTVLEPQPTATPGARASPAATAPAAGCGAGSATEEGGRAV
jgi:hypothetical protein